jgi:RNA polymerase sigma-70 factor, ECF subfamily
MNQIRSTFLDIDVPQLYSRGELPRECSDVNLITRAQNGDLDAIGRLYDQHHASIFRYLWLRLGDLQLADDMTGDVFIRMLDALPRYQSQGIPFRGWLYRIAHNLLVDHFRKTNTYPLIELTALDRQASDSDPASTVEQTLLMERLSHALAQLDQNQREVITLRFLVGTSLHEVALAMGKSEAAVKSLQHRALTALRLELSQEREQVL